MEFASDPVLAGPAPPAERLVIAVEFAAAIAQHGAALGHGMKLPPWIDAVLHGHFLAGAESEQPAAPKGLFMSQPLARRISPGDE